VISVKVGKAPEDEQEKIKGKESIVVIKHTELSSVIS
jgi:hypothetical protein